ncbi:MAG: CoA transferase [Acidobacteria bacterium]|nr:CoA transferase [Acidobacteriota bacterium]
MRPLDGTTVLDLTRVLSGPYCTMMLADMGARVIKIERPGRGDDTRAWGPPFVGGESSYFLTINRNKESVAVDFKRPEGRRILDQLLARADVLVENFQPGTLDAIGLGYRDLAARHPRLIYCSITGYGLTGPQRDRPGYDAVAQAEGGLMSLTGPEGGDPYRLGVAIADIAAGLFAAQGITLAMLARARTGEGQLVDVSLLDSVAALLTYQAGIYFRTGTAPVRTGNRHPSIAPYDTFAAADGTLVLAVGNDEQWKTFCAVVGLDDFVTDPVFATNAARVEHYDLLQPRIARVLGQGSRQSWIDRLVPAGVPCAAVKTLDEVMTDPQLLAREMIEHVEHPSAGPIDLLGLPIKLSATPGRVSAPPPRLGEHTVSVLEHDLGMLPADIARLGRDAVIEIAPPLSGHTIRR